MVKLPIISGTEAVKAFNKSGWSVARQTGSHIIMVKSDSRVTLSVPNHKELDRGTLRKLVKHVGSVCCMWGCRSRAYGFSGDYLGEDPVCGWW
jgi:predicted RNA binding protein YcfA (HicA-like mRNA interferase family)